MIDEIKTLIESLGIDCPNLKKESVIGENDVGLDSQEIVELVCMIDKKFKVNIPHQLLSKKSTVEDVMKAIQNAQEKNANDDVTGFQGECTASLFIDSPLESTYSAIFNMRDWPNKLPHVKEIDVLYDDGVYQEFLMHVASDSGLIKVRSVRRCIQNESVLFFQPDPPVFLKHHCGGWKFDPDGRGCLVTTWHQWNIDSTGASSHFSIKKETPVDNHIEQTLRSHAELALSTWKSNLEAC
ncbi:hypothetical protein [Candidatus Neptunichlamydia sp. REUL1]|uniref:hypothetical protein n=1 Tax=Candidatus Neptunichlamydia sp. REUL1 TaxID=3064277 RepID=UPI002930D63F|nr:hypothetical protein [Candidatus Neptunochlamydia sp. REUL1]